MTGGEGRDDRTPHDVVMEWKEDVTPHDVVEEGGHLQQIAPIFECRLSQYLNKKNTRK